MQQKPALKAPKPVVNARLVKEHIGPDHNNARSNRKKGKGPNIRVTTRKTTTNVSRLPQPSTPLISPRYPLSRYSHNHNRKRSVPAGNLPQGVVGEGLRSYHRLREIQPRRAFHPPKSAKERRETSPPPRHLKESRAPNHNRHQKLATRTGH